MAKWLFKSEPDVFGWDDLVAKGNAGEEWDGVRNYQARNFMRDMARGDRGFFYHSQKEKAVVGIVEVCAPAHPDSTTDDDRWACVGANTDDVKLVGLVDGDVNKLMSSDKKIPQAEEVGDCHSSADDGC